MLTQEPRPASIPFSISHPLRNLRLMECPDDLAELLSRDNGKIVLKLKSSPSTSTSDSGRAADVKREGHLHLCSDEKVWAVKQVSTSNSVYVVQTSSAVESSADTTAQRSGNADVGKDTVTDTDMNSADDSEKQSSPPPPPGHLSAISKPTSILELHPVPAASDLATICRAIRSHVPTLTASDLDADENPDHPPRLHRSPDSVSDLLASIPSPDPLILRAAALLGLTTWDGTLFVPAASLLLATWRRCLDACAIASRPLAALADPEALTALLRQDVGDGDELCLAVARGFLFGETGERCGFETEADGEAWSRWVGSLLLETGTGAGVGVAEFLAAWEDLLPRSWVRFCKLQTVEGVYEVVSAASEGVGGEMVRWNGTGVRSQAGSGAGVAEAAGQKGLGKRKWHEKFRRER